MALTFIPLRVRKARPYEKKLRREDAYAILWRAARWRAEPGETLKDLAAEYGVCYQTVRAIVLRQNHRYLSEIHD